MSPPATLPTEPADMIYSSPAMDHNLQPVLVRVLDDSGNLITDSVTVFATTIDTDNVGASNTDDMYDGQLCMHREYFSRFGWCRYLTDATDRRIGVGTCADELICDNTDPSYPEGKVNTTSVNGVAEFPRLVHTTPALSAHRRLRFNAEHGGDSATVDSEEFEVHRELLYIVHVHSTTIFFLPCSGSDRNGIRVPSNGRPRSRDRQPPP